MLIGIAAFLLVSLLLLAIPLTLTFHACWRPLLDGEVHLQWAFGLVHIRHRLAADGPAPSKADERRRPSMGSALGRAADALGNTLVRRRLLKFVADLWQALRKRDLSVHLRLGLDDPADTGRLWAVIGPVSSLLSACPDATLTAEPVFHGSLFEVESRGSLRFIPLQVLVITLGMALSPATWKGVQQMRGPR